jgi:testis-specific serine kinase
MNTFSSSAKVKAQRKSSDLLALERRGYQFGSKIGKGSYGHVVRANFAEPDTGDKLELACKYVDRSKAPKDFLEKFFPRELELLTKVSHSNIIGIHSILQSGNTIFIFMRFAENGDLLDFVKKYGAIAESQANLWFYQMVSAVGYLHSLGYAHRDLKCENVLISRHMNVKLADFGFTRNCFDGNNKKIMSNTFCGSAGKLLALSPESSE